MNSNEPSTSRMPDDRPEKRKIQDSEAPQSKRIRLDGSSDEEDLKEAEEDGKMCGFLEDECLQNSESTSESQTKNPENKKKVGLLPSVKVSLKQEREKLIKALKDPEYIEKAEALITSKSDKKSSKAEEEEDLRLMLEAFRL